MSDDNEIEFEGVDSQNWQNISQAAAGLARDNFQLRYDAADGATDEFKKYADQMIAEAIPDLPGSLNFGHLWTWWRRRASSCCRKRAPSIRSSRKPKTSGKWRRHPRNWSSRKKRPKPTQSRKRRITWACSATRS